MFWKNVKRLRGTIAFRMAASLAIASAAIMAALCVSLYWLVYWQMMQDDNRFMDDVASLVRITLNSQDNAGLLLHRRIPQELAAFHFNHYLVRIVSETSPEEVLFQSPHFPPTLPELRTGPPPRQSKSLTLDSANYPTEDGQIVELPHGQVFLMLTTRGWIGYGHGRPVLIRIALNITPKIRILRHLQWNLTFLAVIGVVLFSLMGSWLVRRGLMPLEQFSARIQAIGMDSLDRRMGGAEWPSELQPLARSFDRLLARLQKDVDQLTRFSGDLAHELRTPITSLRVGTEVLLEKARTMEEYRAALEGNLLEMERLSGLVERILLLARVDSPQCMAQRTVFPVRPLVEKLLDFYSLLAEEKQIAMTLEGDLSLDADPHLVEQALGNLISNAIKYTPAGGTGRVRVLLQTEARDQHTIDLISVEDNGPGIAQEHLPRVFERFYRADPSRSQKIPGDGLGLAIVQSIMELHGGSVTVETQPVQGCRFSLNFSKQAVHYFGMPPPA